MGTNLLCIGLRITALLHDHGQQHHPQVLKRSLHTHNLLKVTKPAGRRMSDALQTGGLNIFLYLMNNTETPAEVGETCAGINIF
jgi:hypothetical protein